MPIDLPDDLLSAVMQANLLIGEDASITETLKGLCEFHIENSVAQPARYTGTCVRCKRPDVNEIVVADTEATTVEVVCRHCWSAFTGQEALDQIAKLEKMYDHRITE